jgi:hypothetical protein
MKWLIKLAVKYITENKSRSLLTFLSIASAIMVITNILILGATMRARTATSTDVIYGALAFFLGSFLVGNNLMMKLDDRVRSLGILKAIGISKKQMSSLVLFETLILGLAAIISGIFFGALSALAIYLISKRGPGITPFILTPRDLLISFLSGLLMILVASLLPAVKTSRMTVIDAIYSRKEQVSFFDKHSVKIGAFLMIVCLFGVFSFGILDRDLVIIRAWGALSIFGFLLGTSLFSPQSIKLFLLFGSRIIRHSVNHLGQLASENLIINRKRAVLTTLSIMLTVAIFFYQNIENINVSESFAQLSRNTSVGDVSFKTEIRSSSEGKLFYSKISELSKKDKDYWLKPEKESGLSLADTVFSNMYKPETLSLIRKAVNKLPNDFMEIGQTLNYYLYKHKDAYNWVVGQFEM